MLVWISQDFHLFLCLEQSTSDSNCEDSITSLAIFLCRCGRDRKKVWILLHLKHKKKSFIADAIALGACSLQWFIYPFLCQPDIHAGCQQSIGLKYQINLNIILSKSFYKFFESHKIHPTSFPCILHCVGDIEEFQRCPQYCSPHTSPQVPPKVRKYSSHYISLFFII